MELSLDPDMGNSAEKPIELDLYAMADLFGDPAEPGANDAGVDDLFTPSTPAPDMIIPTISADDGIGKPDLDMDMLDAFSRGQGDIFASLDTHSPSNPQTDSLNNKPSQLLSVPSHPGEDISGPSIDAASSPGSLLASLTSDQHGETGPSTSSNVLAALPAGDVAFDIFSGFFPDHQSNDMNMDMDAFLGGIAGSDQQQTKTDASKMEE
jgi:hypothetical protein